MKFSDRGNLLSVLLLLVLRKLPVTQAAVKIYRFYSLAFIKRFSLGYSRIVRRLKNSKEVSLEES